MTNRCRENKGHLFYPVQEYVNGYMIDTAWRCQKCGLTIDCRIGNYFKIWGDMEECDV